MWRFMLKRHLNTFGARQGKVEHAATHQAVKSIDDIPGPKGRPDVGTLYEYTKGPYEINSYNKALLDRYKKYGKIFKETISDITRVHLLDPEYIKQVYSIDGTTPHVPPLLTTQQTLRKKKKMTPGLGNMNGEEWYRLRKGVQQLMMRPQSTKIFLTQENEVCSEFIPRWKSIVDEKTNEIHNFGNEILKWNMETAAYVAFNKRLNCLDAEGGSMVQQMIDSNQNLFKYSLQYLFQEPWKKTEDSEQWRKLQEAENGFYSHAINLIDEAIKEVQDLINRNEPISDKYTFLTTLLSKDTLSYNDVMIITLSLFSDGQSTTCPTMIGQMYCLATNPEKQDRLREEVDKYVPKDKPITSDIINNMTYLKACVKEGFRFFPIGVETSRILQKDINIGGYNLPEGTVVQLNSNLLLRLEEYFQEPNTYKPERWFRDNAENVIHPYLFTPFGFGPRMCAGRRFAEQEMYIMLSRLVQNFYIEWPSGEEMGQEYNVLLKPNKPAQFKFQIRS